MIKRFSSILAAMIIALSLSTISSAVRAENWGIRFDQMPVGTIYKFQNQKGDTWTHTFFGKKGRTYIVEVVNHQNRRKYRVKYSAKGHWMSEAYGSTYKFKRAPHSCYTVIGKCSHVQGGNTKNTGKYVYDVRKLSATKRSGTWRRVTTNETRDFSYTIGKYNLVVYSEYVSKGSKKTNKLISLQEPG